MNFTKPDQGMFDAARYASGRQGFPESVFDFLRERLPNESQLTILDAGCGTGISTRQIREHFPSALIWGIDLDQDMIAEATAVASERVEYRTLNLSFISNLFKGECITAVTAFSAMHWFWMLPDAVKGLVDVLRSEGVFLAANKDTIDEIVPDWAGLLARYIGKPITRPKEGYKPMEILSYYGLKSTYRRDTHIERYTAEGAFNYLLSSSHAKKVPDERRTAFEADLREQIEKRLMGGFVERRVDVTAVIGKKLSN